MDEHGFKLKKIKRNKLLNQETYRLLKYQILEGEFKPGTKLSEVQLAKQLGVSRTPIREAIKCLATEGFVNTIPGFGTVVNGFSLKDLKEILQVRGALEGLAAKLAIEKISSAEINQLEKIISEMKNNSEEKNLELFSVASQKFQELILTISGNGQLINMRNNISDKTLRYRIRSLSSPERLKYSLKEHLDIFEAIKNKDSKMADELSQIHTENVYLNILKHIKKYKET